MELFKNQSYLLKKQERMKKEMEEYIADVQYVIDEAVKDAVKTKEKTIERLVLQLSDLNMEYIHCKDICRRLLHDEPITPNEAREIHGLPPMEEPVYLMKFSDGTLLSKLEYGEEFESDFCRYVKINGHNSQEQWAINMEDFIIYQFNDDDLVRRISKDYYKKEDKK